MRSQIQELESRARELHKNVENKNFVGLVFNGAKKCTRIWSIIEKIKEKKNIDDGHVFAFVCNILSISLRLLNNSWERLGMCF